MVFATHFQFERLRRFPAGPLLCLEVARLNMNSFGKTSRRYKRIVKDLRSRMYDCWICGQPIDYQAKPQTPDAFEPDHVLPKKTHPELAEDPGNIRASHCRCNRSRGAGQPKPGIGDRSRNW